MITICDSEEIHILKEIPYTKTGFINCQGQVREIRDIHQTKQGIQIELFPKHPLGKYHKGTKP